VLLPYQGDFLISSDAGFIDRGFAAVLMFLSWLNAKQALLYENVVSGMIEHFGSRHKHWSSR
jgi:hypothetical protein